MISRIEDLPRHIACLTRPGGAVSIGAADRKVVAVLELTKGKATILWTGRSTDVETRDSARSRTRLAGYEVIADYTAHPEIIAHCHDDTLAVVANTSEVADELETSDATQDFDNILIEAVRLSATDIHIQIDERTAMVRVRINGGLRDMRPLSKSRAETMLRAMWVQTSEDSRSGGTNWSKDMPLDAALTRVVSIDGRIRTIKMRWASGPTVGDGVDLILRVLAREGGIKKPQELGWRREQIEALHEALRVPEGIILLVGITGSGKSTTLASAAYEWLQRFRGRKSLRTIEDPVEIIIPGARHMPVNSTGREEELHGSEFGRALRSALRMDPDGIYVGEVRDNITATLTMHAQQTGHKVFATLHASSPFEAYSRLEDLGINRKKLLSETAINMIAYQRLMPIVCSSCAQSYSDVRDSLPKHLQEIIETDFSANIDSLRFRGKGCKACGVGEAHGDGSIGRQALVHLLVPDATFRHLMTEGHDMLAENYWRGGLSPKFGKIHTMTMHESARQLIRNGLVCPLDADIELGGLRDQNSPAEAAQWYRKQSATLNIGAQHGG